MTKGIDKLQPIALHHKVDGIAAGFAPKAVKELSNRINIKRPGFFLMKWAKPNKFTPPPLKRNALTNEFDDVNASNDLRLKRTQIAADGFCVCRHCTAP